MRGLQKLYSVYIVQTGQKELSMFIFKTHSKNINILSCNHDMIISKKNGRKCMNQRVTENIYKMIKFDLNNYH